MSYIGDEAFSEYIKQNKSAVNAADVFIASTVYKRGKNVDKLVSILPEDLKKEWYDIEKKLKKFFIKAYEFTTFGIAKLEIVHERVGNPNNTNLAECYAGFDPQERSDEVEELKKTCRALDEKLQTFKNKVKLHLGEEEMKLVNEIIDGVLVVVVLAATAGCLYFVAQGAIYFGAAVAGAVSNGASAGAAMTAGVTVAMEPLASGALAAAIAAGSILTEDSIPGSIPTRQVNEALKYLEDVESNVSKLDMSIRDVHKSTRIFAAMNDRDDREYVQEKIMELIEELKKMKKRCKEAIIIEKPKEEPEENGYCTIM